MVFVLYQGVCSGGRDRLFGNSPDEFLFFTPSVQTISPVSTLSSKHYLKFSSFMYSLTNITSLAVPFILKDSLHMSPVHMGLFGAILSVPSFLKPAVTLWVAPEDRPTTLAVCAAAQTALYLVVATHVTAPFLVCASLFGHSVASAVGMVIRDTMLVEEASSDPNLFADLSMVARFGLLPVSYLSGYVLEFFTPAAVVGAAALCPGLVCLVAVFLDNAAPTVPATSVELWDSAVGQIKDVDDGLFSTTAGRGLALSLVPSYADAMFFYYTQVSGFTPEFLGRFQFLGAIAGIAGSGISRALTQSSMRELANVATIASIPLLFSNILLTTNSVQTVFHVSTGFFVLARHFCLDFAASITALPASVQLMRSAPKNAQGTYFALAGTISDMGGVVNSLISSATMSVFGIGSHSFANITSFLVLSNTLSAAASPLLMFAKDDPLAIVRAKEDLIAIALEEPNTSNKLRLDEQSPTTRDG